MNTSEQFNQWNLQKQNIEKRSASYSNSLAYPKISEVWMVALGKNIGFEQNGNGINFGRPVLVIRKFNNSMYWAIPLTSKQKNLDFYHNYIDQSNNAVAAILAQMKLISIKRFHRKIHTIDQNNFTIIIRKIKKLLPF